MDHLRLGLKKKVFSFHLKAGVYIISDAGTSDIVDINIKNDGSNQQWTVYNNLSLYLI